MDKSPLQARRLHHQSSLRSAGTYARIYAVVRRIPKGRVATYGQVAALAGLKGQARRVGYALSAVSTGDALPWQRVINAQGRVSARTEPGADFLQRLLLEEEGVVFDADGRIPLVQFRWRPHTKGSAQRR